MDIKEFTYRLLLLGIPGIITYFLLSKVVGRFGKDGADKLLSIFLFSLISYLAADVFLYVSCKIPCLSWLPRDDNFALVRGLISHDPQPNDLGVLVSAAFAIPLAGALSLLHRKKVWNRLCQAMHLTNRYGDEDVFNYFLESEIDAPRWYIVRDQKESLVYYGAIVVWSDEGEDREILLGEVDVYRNEGDAAAQHLYSCANVYLCRKRDEISIELARQEAPTQNDKRIEPAKPGGSDSWPV